MTKKLRHFVLLEELRALGFLGAEVFRGRTLHILHNPCLLEHRFVYGQVMQIYAHETFSLSSLCNMKPLDGYRVELVEWPVTTRQGELTFLHEMGHIILGHVGTSAKPYVCEWEVGHWLAKLRPAWGDDILRETRDHVRNLCRQREECGLCGNAGWAREICEDVGYAPAIPPGYWIGEAS